MHVCKLLPVRIERHAFFILLPLLHWGGGYKTPVGNESRRFNNMTRQAIAVKLKHNILLGQFKTLKLR